MGRVCSVNAAFSEFEVRSLHQDAALVEVGALHCLYYAPNEVNCMQPDLVVGQFESTWIDKSSRTVSDSQQLMAASTGHFPKADL
jgi:hypothetical protein